MFINLFIDSLKPSNNMSTMRRNLEVLHTVVTILHY